MTFCSKYLDTGKRCANYSCCWCNIETGNKKRGVFCMDCRGVGFYKSFWNYKKCHCDRGREPTFCPCGHHGKRSNTGLNSLVKDTNDINTEEKSDFKVPPHKLREMRATKQAVTYGMSARDLQELNGWVDPKMPLYYEGKSKQDIRKKLLDHREKRETE